MNFFMKGAILIIIIFVALFILGLFVGERCYNISSCKKCWTLENEIEHYNALVDLITCACAEAKAKNFEDVSINSEIERIYKELMKSQAEAKDICSGQVPLIKYEK